MHTQRNARGTLVLCVLRGNSARLVEWLDKKVNNRQQTLTSDRIDSIVEWERVVGPQEISN